MKSPELLVLHYPLDHSLYREGLVINGTVVLFTEPLATTYIGTLCWFLVHSTEWVELSDQEVCIIHKLLVTRPHRPLALFPPLHGSLFMDIHDINLLHCWEVYHMNRSDHNPAMLFGLSWFQPSVELPVDGNRFLILIQLPIWISRFWIPNFVRGACVIKPPKALECKRAFLYKPLGFNRWKFITYPGC